MTGFLLGFATGALCCLAYYERGRLTALIDKWRKPKV